MNDFAWATFIRALLKIGSGFFLSKALADESWLEIGSTLAVAAFATVWGWQEKRKWQRKIRQIETVE